MNQQWYINRESLRDSMGNWLSIEGLERKMRDGFLINRKPTEVEILYIKALFNQIEETITTIEGLVRRLKSSEQKSNIQRPLERETTRLVFVYECLRATTKDNKRLQDQFVFDIHKVKKRTANILETASNLSFQ